MWRITGVALSIALAAAANRGPRSISTRGMAAAPNVLNEVIVVYVGAEGTDVGMAPVVKGMELAAIRQAGASRRRVVFRGVSLEPTVESGLDHLAQLGSFDEVSAGDNWTNSAVIRYLGGDIGQDRKSAIPQIIVLEREVGETPRGLQVSPEREMARYVGRGEIGDWVRAGAPLPR